MSVSWANINIQLTDRQKATAKLSLISQTERGIEK